MSENKDEQKNELNRFGKLITLYAHSRGLAHILPLTLFLLNAFIIVGAMEITPRLVIELKAWWPVSILFAAIIWGIFSPIWFTIRVWPKIKSRFYRSDGEIVLKRRKTSLILQAVFITLFLGILIPGILGIFPFRWTMAGGLAALGLYLIIEGWEEQTMVLYGIMFILVWMEAAAAAAGILPVFFPGKHEFFLSLVIYVAAAWFIATILSHILNRIFLHKVKGMKFVERV